MEDISKVIIFELKEQRYGVDIQQVRSIERLQNITTVPKTSDFIKGVINLRGEITPIIDLRERLNIGKTNDTDDSRVLIVSLNDLQIGLIVDSATDVLDIDSTSIDAAPQIVGDVNVTFVKGVAKLESGLLILLDLERILDLNEMTEVQKVISK